MSRNCFPVLVIILIFTGATPGRVRAEQPETLRELRGRIAAEAGRAYASCPYSAQSRDYFSRFWRDPTVSAGQGDLEVGQTWDVLVPDDSGNLGKRMAAHLVEFLNGPMGLAVKLATRPRSGMAAGVPGAVVLLDAGGGDEVAESFTLSVSERGVVVAGRDAGGLRDGIVKLVDLMGFRRSPILRIGRQPFKPRLAVRIGAVPLLGSYKDLVFGGFNAVTVPMPGDLFELSRSDAIPELAGRRRPESLHELAAACRAAREYGLKTYVGLYTTKKFAGGDPVFKAHPDIRGALTWKAGGDYVLCTEHPLVEQWLDESIEGVFRAAPDLDGAYVIIGGEGFYHCFMRPFGAAKGHTNCPRCEALGPDAVVSDLVNRLGSAARRANPTAEVFAWPYSAAWVWSPDAAQSGFIAKLVPGSGILTEVEKDEVIQTADGLSSKLWDYSIQLPGLGQRARQQVDACHKAGVPILLKSEPGTSLDAAYLPSVPAMDLWAERGAAIAGSGAAGVWVFSGFKPNYGTLEAEVQKYFWWDPAPPAEQVLNALADRTAGAKGGPHLRAAWSAASAALRHVPRIPPYTFGVEHLGPAHPMFADKNVDVPKVFYGRWTFMAEQTDADGLALRPIFSVEPPGGDKGQLWGKAYHAMETELKRSADEVDYAAPLVPQRGKTVFDAEASTIRWYYHTARSEANFMDIARSRDELLQLIARPDPRDMVRARALYAQLQGLLADERENAESAVPVMEGDVRLDYYYDYLSHGSDMLQAKIALLSHDQNEYLPALWKRYEEACAASR